MSMNDVLSKTGRAYRLPIVAYIVGLYYDDLVIKRKQPANEFARTMVEYTTILNSFRNNVDYTLIQHFIKACVDSNANLRKDVG